MKQHHQLHRKSQVAPSTSLLWSPSSSMAVRYGPCLLAMLKGSRLLRPSARGNFSTSPTWSTRPTTECRARSTYLWDCRNPWQLSRHRNSHSLGMSHTITASPKPFFWAPRSAEETLDGQCARVDISAPARTAHDCLLQKRLEGNLCWITPHVESSFISLQWPKPSKDWKDYRLPLQSVTCSTIIIDYLFNLLPTSSKLCNACSISYILQNDHT